ncbi:single-stranded DNA-binding protein, partial [Oenococcus oeni]
VGVEGRIQTRTYDNNQGQKVYVTEVVVDNFQLLETRAQSEARRSQNGSAGNTGNTAPQSQSNFNIPNQQSNPFDSQFNNNASSASTNSQTSSSSSPFNTDTGNDSLDISDDDLPF